MRQEAWGLEAGSLSRPAVAARQASLRLPSSPWLLEAVLCGVLWLGLLLVGRSALVRDPGTFWHTAAGERMLSTGEILRTDPWTFTFAGQRWIAQQWLGECAMALCYRAAGWDGLVLAASALVAVLYSGLARRLLEARLHAAAVAVVVALALCAGTHHFHARPHLATMLLTAATFALLCDVEAGRRPVRSLVWLVPLCVLWANLHGGMLAGLAIIGVVFAGWSCLAVRGSSGPVEGLRGLLLLAALAAAIAGSLLVNPHGLELPWEWWTLLQMPLPQWIEEHRPLDFREPVGWAVVALVILYAAALLTIAPDARRSGRESPAASPSGWLRGCVARPTWWVPLFAVPLACGRVRHAPLLAMVIAIALAELIPANRFAAWLRERGWLAADDRGRDALPSSRWRGLLTPALTAALFFLALGLKAAGLSLLPQAAHVAAASNPASPGAASLLPQQQPIWARLDPSHWPVELVPELRQLAKKQCGQTSASPPRIFNALRLGGFVIFHTPEWQIFIDDRCELVGEALLGEYCHAERHEPERIDLWQRHYGFQAALVESGTPFDYHLADHREWTLVRRTPCAALYRRSASPPCGSAENAPSQMCRPRHGQRALDDDFLLQHCR